MPKPSEVYAPQQVGELAMAEVYSCIEWANRGVRIGFPGADQLIKPLRPGNLCVIQAYTSNFKTGFMMNWARRIAEGIRKHDDSDSVVVYVSWEDSVEEVGLYDLAYDTGIDASDIQEGKLSDEAVNKLKLAAFRRGAMPLWFVGHSIANRKAQSRLTMTQTEAVIGWIESEMGLRPMAIFLDYLNRIQPETGKSWGDNRRTDIMELAYRASDLAYRMGCPVIVGAQSNRVSNNRAWKVPQKWDAMESAAIEQYSQLMLSLWLPCLTEPEGTTLRGPDGEKTDLVVNNNLLIVGVNKQKRGAAGGWF
ncbi:MAG: DnaB-like helicase C-terminal domain-containing protein, partial [Anaerovoracaceae bacterium]